MRAMIVCAILILAAASARAQGPAEPSATHWFGGPAAAFTRMQGANALLLGCEIVAVPGAQYEIGFAGYGLASSIRGDGSTAAARREIGLGLGGIYLAGVIAPTTLIHPVFHVLLGGGAVGYHGTAPESETVAAKPSATSTDIVIQVDPHLDAFVLAEPGFGLQMSVTRNFRVEASVEYRLIHGVTLNGLGDARLGGAAGVLALTFGDF